MRTDYLDPELLNKFEDKFRELEDFLFNKYSDSNGKNKINIVISAKAWLYTIVNGMPYIDLKHENQDYRSLNLLQYLCTINVLVEAIQQLERVFFGCDNYSLFKDTTVFKNEKSDDEYFAHLRAAFGAHPVNLGKGADVNADKIKNERYYASWSTSINPKEFQVDLYSNNLNKKDEEFLINLEDIEEYVQKRYEILNNIINEIDRQYIESTGRKIDVSTSKEEGLVGDDKVVIELKFDF
ncbi:hypothetical protein ICS_05704 [Bacillus cereus BAG2O-3]|nr:hypothetical protein ICS_05704 [Bacillus cereus BAG2O-3]